MKMNIYQKLQHATMHDAIQKCPKAGEMKIGGMLQYRYFKAEDVVNCASKAFYELGIIFTIILEKVEHTSYTKQTKNGNKDVHYFVLEGKAIFINVDCPEEKVEMAFLGSAEDDSDKAIGKANTYAKKIALMNILMIQDGEDTDAFISVEGKKIIKLSSAADSILSKIVLANNLENLNKCVDQIKESQNLITDEEKSELRKAFEKQKNKFK